MKYLFIVLCLISSCMFSQGVQDVRVKFPDIQDLAYTDKYIDVLEDNSDDLSQAYLAVLYFMKSKFLNNPFTKIKYFNKGKDLLDVVISNHPDKVEYRYLRFGLQTQVPAFLGYNDKLKEDFDYIISNIQTDDLSLNFKRNIIENLLLIEDIEAWQKEKLEQKLIEI